MLMLLFLQGKAQKKAITVDIPVRGNCEMCKKRIENAADIKGVKLAEWSEKEQMIRVTYLPEKTNEDKIIKAIVDSGHEVKGIKPSKEKYNVLPSCCQYESNKCEMK
jgi:copper chaperone CopZ